MFSQEELAMLSDALIGAIGKNTEARSMVSSKAAKDAIDAEIAALQTLNNKVCGMMHE